MNGFQCAECGRYHEGVPLSWGPDVPAAWAQHPDPPRGRRNYVDSDACILAGERHFVRGCLDLPIRGSAEVFRWLVWVELARPEYRRVSSLWMRLLRRPHPPCDGSLDTELPYDVATVGLPVRLHWRGAGLRPFVEVRADGHPLREEQTGGIPPERACELAGICLHRLEPPGPRARLWRSAVLPLLVLTLSCSGPSGTPASERASRDPGRALPAPSTPAAPALLPFRADTSPHGPWGYRTATGRVVIAPRYEAAAQFSGGEALVLLEGEYVFVGPSGDVRRQLRDVAAARTLPLPSDSCSSLAQYAEELGALTPPYTLLADPSEGESTLTLEVRRLRFGALEVRERGWEGSSLVLVLPHLEVEDARAIVRRILRHREHRDITAERVFGDEATYEFLPPESAGEFLGIRSRPQGGVEIHHTHWFG